MLQVDPTTPLIRTERDHANGRYPYLNWKTDFTKQFGATTKLETGVKLNRRETANVFDASYLNSSTGAYASDPIRATDFDYHEDIGAGYALLSNKIDKLQTQAGLRLARTLLGRQRTSQKHILLITDGRPTAAYLDGQLHLHTRGLHPVIIEETYKEAKRCREQEITLNTFMLADEEPLVQFVKRLTAISQGRAFYTTPERLGHYVLEDYIRRR